MCNRWGISCLSQYYYLFEQTYTKNQYYRTCKNKSCCWVATVTFLLTHSCWQIITQIHYILLAVHLLRLRTLKKLAMNVLLKSVSKRRRRWLTSCKLKPQSTQKKCYCVAYVYYYSFSYISNVWQLGHGRDAKNISAELWTQFVPNYLGGMETPGISYLHTYT